MNSTGAELAFRPQILMSSTYAYKKSCFLFALLSVSVGISEGEAQSTGPD